MTRKTELYVYDSSERVKTVIHADASTIGYTYDGNGNVLTVKDENHSTPNTHYSYDPAGRLSRVEQTLTAGTITTAYVYDRGGNLSRVTDPNGNLTTYTYDDFGAILSQSSPVTGVTRYTYDPAGHLISLVDANGATTSRSYDALGRVSSAISSRGARSELVSWAYDLGTFGMGRLTSMIDTSGSTNYEYDRRGLLSRETKIVGNTAYVTSFRHDRDGNRSALIYPSGRVVSTSFDFAGRPISAFSATVPLVVSAKYLPFGPMTEVVYGNGTVRNMTFDQRYRPLTNKLMGPQGLLAAYEYGHDNTGNVTSIDDSLSPDYNRSFGYDDLNRLVTANAGASLWGAGAYAYDAMGNMRTETIGSRSTTFDYEGTTARLTSVASNNTIEPVAYDSAGNEISVGTAESSYSPRNSLELFRESGFIYDGRGVRTLASKPASLLSLTVPPEVGGGRTVVGTVTLYRPAPEGGAVIALLSDSAVASVPSFVTIAEGQMAEMFSIVTSGVLESMVILISATYEGLTLSGSMAVETPALTAVTVQGSSLKGGQSAPGSVLLSAPAPAGGAVVALSSSDPSRLSVPTSVTVTAGEEEATFTVSAPVTVPAEVIVFLEAEYGGAQSEVSVSILPPAIQTLTFEPATIEGGVAANAVVALESPPVAGTMITFTAPSPHLVIPAPVTMTAGVPTISVEVATAGVTESTSVVLTAHLAPSSASAPLTLLPSAVTLQAFAVAPDSIAGSLSATGTVTLTAPAPAGGLEVELWPFEDGLVPPFIRVPAGQTQATFGVASPSVLATEVQVLRARHGRRSSRPRCNWFHRPRSSTSSSISRTPTSAESAANRSRSSKAAW